jgi:hypothetical protein
MPFALGRVSGESGRCRAPAAVNAVVAATDPVLALWRDLMAARSCARNLTQRQQAIESVMLERVGFPVVRVALAGGGHVSVADPDELPELMAGEMDGAESVAAVQAALEAHQARWAAADAALGYSAALRAEGQALARVRDLADRLWAMPATSLSGVLAKLDALLEEGPPSSVAADLPWPQLRAMRRDLEKLDVAPPSPLRR